MLTPWRPHFPQEPERGLNPERRQWHSKERRCLRRFITVFLVLLLLAEHVEEAEAEGIRPEVAFAQTMKDLGEWH